MKRTSSTTIALLALALSACGGQSTRQQAAVASPPVQSDAATAFRNEHAHWLAQRESSLSAPDGWLSLIGLHWVEAGIHLIGSDAGNGIQLAIGPARLGEIERRGDAVFFRAAQTADVRIGGTPVQGEIELHPENREDTTRLSYDDGRGQITVIGRGEKLGLRVRHADAPTRLNFTGLNLFPADPQWQVEAHFIANPPGTTLPIVNVIGDVNQVPNPGYVQFEKNGQHWTLQALGDPTKGLSLSFQDASSGRETYGVGRYLATGPVAADGTVAINFNRAYNPPCAYTNYATCPLPPPENRLAYKNENGQVVRLAVLAGEKIYAQNH